MKVELNLEIMNLHACPGDALPKKYLVSKDLFAQVDIETVTESFFDESEANKEISTETEKKRTKIEPLFAFKIVDDKPIVRFGGPYGKMAGASKEAGSMLYTLKDPLFKSAYKSVCKVINWFPQWITLENVSGIEISKIPQIMAGRSKSMIIQYYEVIPKCTATISIEYPEDPKNVTKKVKRLIEKMTTMPFGPKRRGEFRITNVGFFD